MTEQRLRAFHDVPQARHAEERDEDDEHRIRRPNRHEQTEGESQRDRRPRSRPLVDRQPQADDRRDEEERESVAEDRVVRGVVEQCGPEGDRDKRHHDRRPREPPEQHEAELCKPDQREDEAGGSGRDLIRRGEPVGRLARETSQQRLRAGRTGGASSPRRPDTCRGSDCAAERDGGPPLQGVRPRTSAPRCVPS